MPTADALDGVLQDGLRQHLVALEMNQRHHGQRAVRMEADDEFARPVGNHRADDLLRDSFGREILLHPLDVALEHRLRRRQLTVRE